MTIPTLSTVVANIVTSAAALMHRRQRAHKNAWTIRYLDEMPAYLRDDIGLPPDVEIHRVVEYGGAAETADFDMRRNLGVMSHPL